MRDGKVSCGTSTRRSVLTTETVVQYLSSNLFSKPYWVIACNALSDYAFIIWSANVGYLNVFIFVFVFMLCFHFPTIVALRNCNNIQSYYKRDRQFQYFIEPILFKISTLTMHGFLEKHWQLYRCHSWWRKQREVRNYLDANLPQSWIGRATCSNMSLTCWPPQSRELTP
jgi:hypothetical protein